MKIEDMTLWEAFLGVARHRSFSKAAVTTGIPLAQISKRVARLESQLNVRLFQRTTRVVTLTDEGTSLLPRISSVLEDLRETECLLESQQDLSGVVKVTCVPFIATRLILPILAEFRKRYPKIHLDFELSESFVDLIEDGFDMALRIETPSDSQLIYRKLRPNDLIFCASKKYLNTCSIPKTPKDLKNHSLLMLSIHRKVKFKDQAIALAEFEKLKHISCENGSFLTDLAVAGNGILVRSIWDAEPLIREGNLIQVLSDFPLDTFGHIHAVVPSKRFLSPRVKAFWDFVIRRLANYTETH